jgi:hypothetical protein
VTATRPSEQPERRAPPPARGRYLAGTVALTAAGLLLAVSLFLPYWELTLTTPAEPGELRLVSYLASIDGPIEEVLAAAGARGAPRLQALTELERSLALAIAAVICLLVVATFVDNRWAALLALPAFCFPAIVVADTARWLKPTVDGLATVAGAPPANASILLFGRLVGGGLILEIEPGTGLMLATLASLAVAAGLWLHRSAARSAGSR